MAGFRHSRQSLTWLLGATTVWLLSSTVLAQEPARCETGTQAGPAWTMSTGCLLVPLDHKRPDGQHISIYYEASTPHTKPRGVLIQFHGGPGYPRRHLQQRGMLWEGILSQYAVVYYHQRGTGYSGLITAREQLAGKEHLYDLDASVHDAKMLVDILFPNLPITVFGKSAGGFLALKFAVQWPQRVEKVVVACTGADSAYLTDEASIERWFAADMEQRHLGYGRETAAARSVRTSDLPLSVAELMTVRSMSAQFDSLIFDLQYSLGGQFEMVLLARETAQGRFGKLESRLRQGRINLPPSGLESTTLLAVVTCREIGYYKVHPFSCLGVPVSSKIYDVKGQLPILTMPVLVISGRYDRVLPPMLQETIVNNLTNAPVTWVVFELSGHMVFQEQENLSSQVILDFLGIVRQQPAQRRAL